MKNMFTTLIASILLTACATTDTTENSNVAEKSNAIVFTGFSSSEDGTMTQTMRGFVCPPKVNAMELKNAELLSPDGSDAFCNYNDSESEIFTTYLSKFPNTSMEEYFQSSFFSTNLAMEKNGLTHDEELSGICQISGIGESLLSKILMATKEDNKDDKAIELTPIPAAVFTGPGNKLSILTIHETDEHEYLKYRYSLPGSTKEDTEAACDFLNAQSKFHRKYINEVKGIETLSHEEQLSQLLNALEASEE